MKNEREEEKEKESEAELTRGGEHVMQSICDVLQNLYTETYVVLLTMSSQ